MQKLKTKGLPDFEAVRGRGERGGGGGRHRVSLPSVAAASPVSHVSLRVVHACLQSIRLEGRGEVALTRSFLARTFLTAVSMCNSELTSLNGAACGNARLEVFTATTVRACVGGWVGGWPMRWCVVWQLGGDMHVACVATLPLRVC